MRNQLQQELHKGVCSPSELLTGGFGTSQILGRHARWGLCPSMKGAIDAGEGGLRAGEWTYRMAVGGRT